MQKKNSQAQSKEEWLSRINDTEMLSSSKE
jgi:hypothetical protein